MVLKVPGIYLSKKLNTQSDNGYTNLAISQSVNPAESLSNSSQSQLCICLKDNRSQRPLCVWKIWPQVDNYQLSPLDERVVRYYLYYVTYCDDDYYSKSQQRFSYFIDAFGRLDGVT